jgi:hypothetical protein
MLRQGGGVCSETVAVLLRKTHAVKVFDEFIELMSRQQRNELVQDRVIMSHENPPS